MAVDARPNVIVRLWPKLPSAAAPPYASEFRPTTPIAFDASSMTREALSSAAARPATSAAISASAAVNVLLMLTSPENRKPAGSTTGFGHGRQQVCALAGMERYCTEKRRHGLWRGHTGEVTCPTGEYVRGLQPLSYWMTLTLPPTAGGSTIAAPLLSW